MTAVTKPEARALAEPVSDIIALAVSKDLDVDKLQRLIDMKVAEEVRQARREFAAALAAFQRECPSIRHERTAKITTKGGGSYSYTYAELDVIARVVNPILAAHGLSYRWNAEVSADGRTLHCDCVVTHEAGHSEASRFTLPIDNASAMSDQQKVGAAATYARRQSLTMALGLTTTDDDTDAAAVDPSPVTDDQATAILDRMAEVGVNETKFLRYMGVERVEQIRAADFQRAMNALQQKAERRAGA